jgi:ACS family hexuronate transporter-like MFS transporter
MQQAMRKGLWSYETMLMILLSLNFGIVFFDRNAMSYLAPFVQPDLKLSNEQIGLFASGLSFTWAISGFVIGTIADRAGHRKAFLVVTVILFSLCSVMSGLAGSFLILLAARMVMGAAEGPLMPISQSFAAAESSPERRGLNMGFVQNFGSNLFGSFVAPLVIVALANAFGWRTSFFLAAIPGLLSAFLLWTLIREPRIERPQSGEDQERMPIREMLRYRNIWLCMVIAVFMVAWMVLGWTFLPLVYVHERLFSTRVMSYLMSVLGASAALGAFILPGLSDRIGRKPIMFFGAMTGVLVPMAALYWRGSIWILGLLLFVGWLANGICPLLMATIPSETIPARYVATTAGLVQGLGEIIGASGGAWAAGRAADAFGLPVTMWAMGACALVATALALLLKETAPIKTGKTLSPHREPLAVPVNQ